jgi:O-antigen/teichoic acid export membrane protein
VIDSSTVPQHRRTSGLLHEISRSIFWNTALLPVLTASGVLLSILVRRTFGLESGLYDAVLAIANSILFYSSLGLAGSLPKFLPELQVLAGRRAASRFVWRLASIRLGVLIVIIVALNAFADPLLLRLNLGPEGTIYLRWLTALLIGRAILDFVYRALDSFLQQLRVNLLSLLNGILDLGMAGAAVIMGLRLVGVVGALAVSALATAVVAIFVVQTQLRDAAEGPGDRTDYTPSADRVWKLSGVTYLRDLSLYFATPAFASPVLLTVLGGPEPVALFATSYFIAASTVTLVVSGFRGVYRPAFARVMAAGERAQLQRAFDLMNKVQVLAVVPAGAGLAVMVADYLPLLYGQPFSAAVPVARLLVVLLFAETAMAVGLLVLWVDEQFRPVLMAQAVMIAGAPLFIWTAGEFGLLPSALVLGGSRLAASVLGYTEARRLYGVRYPWRFAAKVLLMSLVMVACVASVRAMWPTSALEAVSSTILGVLIIAVGLRLFRVLGPGELELLGRTSIPGKYLLIRWLRGDRAD